MRVAFIGIQHWHARHYYGAVSRLSKHTIVGVSDPNAATAQKVASDLGTKAYTDCRELIEAQRPDFVFVFGHHDELAATGRYVIDCGIPCLIEKPAGMNEAEVADLRDLAAEKRLHVGTGFNFRVSDFYRQVMALIEHDEVTWASFRFIAGGPSRYRESGNAWMLDAATSGGGSTINLSVHFFDMFRQFTRSDPGEVVSLMGNHTWRLPVEDYSSVSLRSSAAVCTVETGYTFPGAGRTPYDLRFCVRTSGHYIIGRSDDVIEIHSNANGEVKQIATPSCGNAYWYPTFVQQTLQRCERGEPPIADLRDLASAMRIVDAAYASDRASSKSGGAIQAPPA
ncbi:hypothetical protein BH09PSE5_BH09PSE5_46770 [soil metagenome]